MDVMGTMRDLDQIRERDDRGENSKLVLVAVGGLAAACVLFAMGVMIGKDHDSTRAARREDPLARLDALAAQMASSAPPSVTYPSRLGTDSVAPSGAPSANAGAAAVEHVPSQQPAAAPERREPDGLRARADVPLAAAVDPGGRVREQLPEPAVLPVAGPNRARITLTNATAANGAAAPAAAGSDGAFTLQVSSFRTAAAAQSLSQRLRERGHRSFVATAPPQNGVTWHRVRIGPFTRLHEAQRYRTDFEARERLPTFVVRRDLQVQGD
jgi:cell division septation protein DedD